MFTRCNDCGEPIEDASELGGGFFHLECQSCGWNVITSSL